ncbi:hypothetical protein VEE15_26250 [Escherichia coli]|nr:hypothetical protein VEE15_26250 [Escherichia coli]
MSKTIATENAPAAIGPYVQGVDLGNMIITSGQIPVNPKTGEVPADVAAQARQSLDNVKAIVEAAGLKVGDIVKTTVLCERSERLRNRKRHLRSLLHRTQRHLPGTFLR